MHKTYAESRLPRLLQTKTINRSDRFFLHALQVLHGEGVSQGRTLAITSRQGEPEELPDGKHMPDGHAAPSRAALGGLVDRSCSAPPDHAASTDTV